MDVVRYLYDHCEYDDILAMKTRENTELPIQVFIQELAKYTPQWNPDYNVLFKLEERFTSMASFFAEQRLDDSLMYLDDSNRTVMIQMMCKIGFVETNKYLTNTKKKFFLSYTCSLKQPPYSSIDRVELMHMAAWFGRTDILQYLIGEENIDPFEKKLNTLFYACKICSLDVIQYFWSDEKPCIFTIKLLIETGCSIFYNDPYFKQEYHFRPLFEHICYNQDMDTLKALTSLPESVNSQDKEGNTPLMIVIKYGLATYQYDINNCSNENNIRRNSDTDNKDSAGNDDVDYNSNDSCVRCESNSSKKGNILSNEERKSEKLKFVIEASRFLIEHQGCNQSLRNYNGCSAILLACESDLLLDVGLVTCSIFTFKCCYQMWQYEDIEVPHYSVFSFQ